MLPTKFRFIWQSGFRIEDLKKSANQKQELPVAAMFVNRSGQKCCLGLFVKMFLAQTVDTGELSIF